jgi:hypothetical protein
MRLGWLGSLGLMASLASGGCWEGVGTEGYWSYTVNRFTGEVCVHAFVTDESSRMNVSGGDWRSPICENDKEQKGWND